MEADRPLPENVRILTELCARLMSHFAPQLMQDGVQATLILTDKQLGARVCVSTETDANELLREMVQALDAGLGNEAKVTVRKGPSAEFDA